MIPKYKFQLAVSRSLGYSGASESPEVGEIEWKCTDVRFHIYPKRSIAQLEREPVGPSKAEIPKIKGPFWVVLVFGRAKWTSIKGEMGLSARKLGLKAVQTRKTSAIFFLNHDQRI